MLSNYETLYSYLDMLPVGCAVYKVKVDETGKPYDFYYEFANKTYCSWVGRDLSELTKKSFFTVIENAGDEWLNICYRTAYLDQMQQFIHYVSEIDRWLNIYVTRPAYGYCFYTCIDITNEKKVQEDLKLREADEFIFKCIHLLQAERSVDTAIKYLLKELGESLQAERMYILETNQVVVSQVYEWCKQGIASQQNNLQQVPYYMIAKWEKQLQKREFIFLQDIYDFQANQRTGDNIFIVPGLERLLAVPLYDGFILQGYVAVDNYSEDKTFFALKVMPFVACIIVAYLKNNLLTKQLANMGNHDLLTNSLNRIAFAKYLRDNYHDFYDVGALYIDINGLKNINDIYGHSKGDYLICAMYNLLVDIFSVDVIYRMGGDEFVVLENHITKQDFKKHIKKLFSKTKTVPMLYFACGYHWVSGRPEIYELLKIADRNMYEDKKRFYTHSVIKSSRYRSQLDDRFGFSDNKKFREFLQNGQIIFYLQSKFTGGNHSLAGAEALVRYKRNNGEIVPAGEFIELLEATNNINELDYYVFKNVCQQIKIWLDDGLRPARVAVNFSRHTLSQINFLDEVVSIWEKCPIPKEYIEFEITESAVAENQDTMKDTIGKLRQKGFTVSMDDFGVEQANLSTFTEIDFDYVKIDKSLIDTIPHMNKTNILIKGLIGICHDLGIKVVAEGVEHEAQLHKLEEMGVDEIQGYYFSKAVSCDEFTGKYLLNE